MEDEGLSHHHSLGTAEPPERGAGGQVGAAQPPRGAEVGDVVAAVHAEQRAVHHLPEVVRKGSSGTVLWQWWYGLVAVVVRLVVVVVRLVAVVVRLVAVVVGLVAVVVRLVVVVVESCSSSGTVLWQ